MHIHKTAAAAKRVSATVATGLILCLWAGCAKDPCLQEWGCKDCNCLFDKYQASQSDLAKMEKIQECYDRACK
ncbi:MAG: hypothetical protein GF344_09180 [Chitinivibrionales bacterium]|nr:hypothetical protein [Chitinivibrionales bacterium]MBD3357022.1 hypothetical protein [Chitinivibrionales bacterium]